MLVDLLILSSRPSFAYVLASNTLSIGTWYVSVGCAPNPPTITDCASDF